jgi:hypothetical protein
VDDRLTNRDTEDVSIAHFILAPSHTFVRTLKTKIIIRMEELEEGDEMAHD